MTSDETTNTEKNNNKRRIICAILGAVAIFAVFGWCSGWFSSSAPPASKDLERASQVTILAPENGDVIEGDTKLILNSVYIPMGFHLWPMEERAGVLWPKEPEVILSGKGFTGELGFYGEPGELDLKLFLVPASGHRKIRRWFFICRFTGKYPGFTPQDLAGAVEIGAVSDLQQK